MGANDVFFRVSTFLFCGAGFLAVTMLGASTSSERAAGSMTTAERLEAIEIPEVTWDQVPLGRVVRTLDDLAREFDPEEVGVNIVVHDPEELDPEVSLRLRGLSLKRILELVALQTDFFLDIEEDVAILRAEGDPRERLETEIFPMSRQALIRMIGPVDEVDPDGEDYDPFR